MVTEDEGDKGANGSSSGDRQGGDRQTRVGEDGQDGDRQGDESEGNSRATRRQRLGGGGGSRSSDVETGYRWIPQDSGIRQSDRVPRVLRIFAS
jgi:hypothetical protein